MSRKRRKGERAAPVAQSAAEAMTATPIWATCSSCGNHDKLIPEVGMCGPCTFGEAETAGGNW